MELVRPPAQETEREFLCDDKWRVIKISKDGWAIINDSPVRSATPACARCPSPIC
jgi:hypothetical protein